MNARRITCLVGLLCAWGLSLPTPPALAAEPAIALPASARPFSVGERMVVNGVPMRILGFSSSEPIDDIAAWFRRSLGQPLVENRFNGTLILGKAVDSHYLTVQLETAANGTRGVAAVSDLGVAEASRRSHLERTDRWLSAFPAGARLLSDMSSEDRGKHSRHLVIVAAEGAQASSERLQALMVADGFALEREVKTGGGAAAEPADARTLYFKGENKEAMATISRDDRGQTTVVINTISALKRYP